MVVMIFILFFAKVCNLTNFFQNQKKFLFLEIFWPFFEIKK